MAKTVTRKSKALKLKRKLKKEFSVKRKYATTYKDIKKYFKEFNNAIFDNKLSPFGQIQIKDLKREKCVGQVITFEWKRKGTHHCDFLCHLGFAFGTNVPFHGLTCPKNLFFQDRQVTFLIYTFVYLFFSTQM